MVQSDSINVPNTPSANNRLVYSDTLSIYPFQSVVIALTGEQFSNQTEPITDSGVYDVAAGLRDEGYNVWFADEDDVFGIGDGPVYDNVVRQIQSNGITQVTAVGHSHGGGSVYSLVNRLNNNRAAIGAFSVDYTGYLAAISNNSNAGVIRENRRPPSSGFHATLYQLTEYWPGDPVVADGDENIDVTNWNGGLDHGSIDNDSDVQSHLINGTKAHASR